MNIIGGNTRALGFTLCAVAATSCASPAQRPGKDTAMLADSINPASVPGTYDIRVCRMACPPDSASPLSQGALLRRGILVLTGGPTGFDGRRDSVGILLSGFFPKPGNGCYKLAIVREDPPSYAYTLGGTHWQIDSTGRAIDFSLFNSPDAGYGVHATLVNGVLHAKGESWGAGAAAVDYPPDVVQGRRVGPPDLAPCLEAVGPAWKEITSLHSHAHHKNGEW